MFDSLYCNICFIAVVWNKTHSISNVCLSVICFLLDPKDHRVRRAPGIPRERVPNLSYKLVLDDNLSLSVPLTLKIKFKITNEAKLEKHS